MQNCVLQLKKWWFEGILNTREKSRTEVLGLDAWVYTFCRKEILCYFTQIIGEMTGRNARHTLCTGKEWIWFGHSLAFIIWEPEEGGKQMFSFSFLIIKLVLECPVSCPSVSSSLLLSPILNFIWNFLRQRDAEKTKNHHLNPLQGWESNPYFPPLVSFLLPHHCNWCIPDSYHIFLKNIRPVFRALWKRLENAELDHLQRKFRTVN